MPAIDPRNIEVVDVAVIGALRQLSGRDTLRQALEAHELGRRLVESGVRAQWPGLADDRVRVEVVRRMHGDAIAALAAGDRDA